MDIKTEKLHMLRQVGESQIQPMVMGEIQLPPTNPVIREILMEQGDIELQELLPGKDVLTVRGLMDCQVLYCQDNGELARLEGQLPFEETMPFQGLEEKDELQVDVQVEDISAVAGSGTKVAIRGALTVWAQAFRVMDNTYATGVNEADALELQWKEQPGVAMLSCKKETLKLRKEIAVGAGDPAIEEILWKDLCLQDMTERCQDGSVRIQGQAKLSLLYRGEDVGNGCSVVPFESSFQISEELETTGAKMTAVPKVRYQLTDKRVSVLPDLDGEERILLAEAVLVVSIWVYENQKLQVLQDAYSTQSKVELKQKEQQVPTSLLRMNGRTRIEKKITASTGREGEEILQLLSAYGSLKPLGVEKTKQGILLKGILDVTMLLVVGQDEMPYRKEEATIPYEYLLETGELDDDTELSVESRLENVTVTIGANGVLDIQAVGYFEAVYCRYEMCMRPEELVEEMIPKEELDAMPDMVVVRVGAGENLWTIGKRYFLKREQIMETNELQEDTLTSGQKLLLVRGTTV